jgi:hypothetical protein
MTINAVAQTLSSISLGPELTFQNLTMVPLLRNEPEREPEYAVLDTALGEGTAEITEVSDHGSVPELRVVNRGPQPVLIVDGEELVGAKQNRVVNLTILVPAKFELTIPVSCVEAGRWRARSKNFSSAPRAQYATGRAKRMSQVTACMRDVGAYHADQADVWSDIAEKSARMGAKSPTSAMEAIFVDHASTLDEFVRTLHPIEHQVGALFAVSGRIVGLDLFDRPSTLRKVLPKLVRSVAIDAIDSGTDGPAARGRRPALPGPASDGARLFVAALSSAPAHVAKAIGLGDDWRLSAPGLTGAALEMDGAVVHLSGFAV